MSTTEKFMARAIEISRRQGLSGRGGPFGAVVVRDGRMIAEGCNQVTSEIDPTAHAEIVAIRAACQELGRFDLSGCEIYSSCEPCPMCLAAIYWARLDRGYYANDRDDAARIGFDDAELYREIVLPAECRSVPMVHLSSSEALKAFSDWAASPDKVPY